MKKKHQKPKKPAFDRYAHYIEAVQSVEHDVELYRDLFKQARRKEPRFLREDFCGTHALSCEWVKLHRDNRAIALDLDPEPLEYGRTHAETTLNTSQHSRLQVFQKNVLSQTEATDLIVAGNFSYFIFKQRAQLLAYFKKARESLKPGLGMLILDVAGGSSMIEHGVERRTIRSKELGKYTYIWECVSFDPVTHDAKFAIHFELPQGKTGKRRVRNAFTYDWRLWSIPELKEILMEAGFKSTAVFWDTAKSNSDEKYEIVEKGANHEAWIAYVTGLA